MYCCCFSRWNQPAGWAGINDFKPPPLISCLATRKRHPFHARNQHVSLQCGHNAKMTGRNWSYWNINCIPSILNCHVRCTIGAWRAPKGNVSSKSNTNSSPQQLNAVLRIFSCVLHSNSVQHIHWAGYREVSYLRFYQGPDELQLLVCDTIQDICNHPLPLG